MIALVVCWHRHNRTRTVAAEHVVRHPDRDFVAIDGVDSVAASEYAGFLLVFLTLNVGLASCRRDIRRDRFARFRSREFLRKCMLWRQCNIRRTKQRIWTCRKYGNQLIRTIDLKFNFSANTAADPIFLHRFDHLCPIQIVSRLEHLVSICRDAEKPLFEIFLGDGIAATPTFAALNLFVGEHRIVRLTPPLCAFLLIR